MSDANALNPVVWVDLPVVDLTRAVAFYQAVLAVEIETQSFDGAAFAVFKHNSGNGACLVPGLGAPTAEDGPLVYFNVDGRLSAATVAVAAHGGRVLEEPHSMGPHGWRAVVVDSEGNRIAPHSSTEN